MNLKLKIKQRKRTAAIKKLRSVYISDQKTKRVYFELRPLPILSYATAEYCLYFFFIFRVWGGHSSPPPYASGCHSPQKSSRSSMKLICICREWC